MGYSLATKAPWLFAAAGLAALAAVFILQYGFDVQPCILCIYQRWACAAATALAVAALLAAPGSLARGVLTALTGAAFTTGAAIALYHVGVEQHWWQGTAACTGGPAAGGAIDIDALLAAPIVRCDVVSWSLFGISAAGYNLVLSLVLGDLAVLAAVLQLKGTRR